LFTFVAAILVQSASLLFRAAFPTWQIQCFRGPGGDYCQVVNSLLVSVASKAVSKHVMLSASREPLDILHELPQSSVAGSKQPRTRCHRRHRAAKAATASIQCRMLRACTADAGIQAGMHWMHRFCPSGPVMAAFRTQDRAAFPAGAGTQRRERQLPAQLMRLCGGTGGVVEDARCARVGVESEDARSHARLRLHMMSIIMYGT